MKKVIRINESEIEKIVKKIIKENEDHEMSNRYMFFSNLQQIKRQCEYLLEFDEDQIESILEDGHDWAQDHIAEAKNNMDQVFDFLMNEIKGDGDVDEEEMPVMYNESEEPKPNQKLKVPCTRIAKRKYDVWPSVKASVDIGRCMKGEIWGNEISRDAVHKKLKK